jgi:hypothetical protein
VGARCIVVSGRAKLIELGVASRRTALHAGGCTAGLRFATDLVDEELLARRSIQWRFDSRGVSLVRACV